MIVHYWAQFPQQDAKGSLIEALDDPIGFISPNERYNMSKVLDVFMAREIAKLPAVTSGKVNVNSANPGEPILLFFPMHLLAFVLM
jgi:retinol dehydrogenase-12